MWSFLSHCKKFVVSLKKDCFDHVDFHFQFGFQKAAVITFSCIQHYEYDHCFDQGTKQLYQSIIKGLALLECQKFFTPE